MTTSRFWRPRGDQCVRATHAISCEKSSSTRPCRNRHATSGPIRLHPASPRRKSPRSG